MGLGTALDNGSSGENINHYTAVRMRVNGSGNLKMSLFSLDDIRSTVLLPFAMVPATNIEPTRNCNFMEQRASLEIKTTEINETFKINRIIIFVKETYTSYPDRVNLIP